MALDREYKIESSNRTCGSCERTFEPGDAYFSAVVETDDESLLAREDYCPDCWEPSDAYFSFWKTRVPEPTEEPAGPRRIDVERLMPLFERLEESEGESADRFRYVVALMLMRKRRLKLVDARRLAGGGEEMKVREAGTGRRWTVTCPDLSEEEMLAVADRLRGLLDMPQRWDATDEPSDDESEPAEPDA